MCWDDIFKSLIAELGREPDSGEVQERMLEIVSEPPTRGQKAAPSRLLGISMAPPVHKGA